MASIKDINRLKVVLAEKKRTGKWLAEQLNKDHPLVSVVLLRHSGRTAQELLSRADSECRAYTRIIT